MFDPPDNIYKKQALDTAVQVLKGVYPRHYCGDSMFIANRNMSFFDDEKFSACLEKHALAEPFIGMAWRMHVLVWAASLALRQEGAFMEFGTFRGFKFKFLMDYYKDALSDRKIYLFDTFEGIDPAQAEGSPIAPEEHQKAGLYEFVLHRFAENKNVDIVKGAAPQSLDNISLDQISLLHLDMNSWQAEIGVLEKLWDKIVPGGVIVLDDFGFYQHRAQMEHELPWLLDRGHTPLELPTGQGVVIKNV